MQWYPWYPLDFKRDTLHLTLAEDGAYRRLIDEYMDQRQPLPDDDRILARLIGVSVPEWKDVSDAVRSFFHAENGALAHKRCDIEIAEQGRRERSVSKQRKEAAKARWGNKKKLVPGRIRAGNEPHTGRIAARMRAGCESDAGGMLQDTTLQDSSSSARGEPDSPTATEPEISNDDCSPAAESYSFEIPRALSPKARLCDLFRDRRISLWPSESKFPAPDSTLETQADNWLCKLTETDIADVVRESLDWMAENEYPAPQSFDTIAKSLQRRLGQKKANGAAAAHSTRLDKPHGLVATLTGGEQLEGDEAIVWSYRSPDQRAMALRHDWFAEQRFDEILAGLNQRAETAPPRR